MKKFSKTLLVGSLCLLMSLILVFTAFANGDYDGTVEELILKLDAIEQATTQEDKDLALSEAQAYIATVHPTEEGYDDAKTRYNTLLLAEANALLAQVDINLGTAKNGVAIGRVTAFLRYYPIDTAIAGYQDFAAALEAKQTEQTEKMAAQLADMEKDLLYEEYVDTPVYHQDYLDLKVGSHKAVKNTGGNSNLVGTINDGVEAYYRITYNALAHSYVLFQDLAAEGKTIFEFDYTVFSDIPAGKYVAIEHQSVNGKSPIFLKIYGDGRVEINKGETVADCIVKGAWTRFTLVIDSETTKFDVYMNYEKIGSGTALSGTPFVPNYIRVGSAQLGPDDGCPTIAVDNVLVYHGSGIRNVNRVSDMDPEDQFIFLVDGMLDNRNGFLAIDNAYREAGKLLYKFWNGATKEYVEGISDEAKAAVDSYLAFDYDAVLATIKANNLTALKEITDRIAAFTHTLDNIADRETLLAEAEAFIAEYKDLTADAVLDEEGNTLYTYAESEDVISDLRISIDQDKAAKNFIIYVNRFETGLSLAAQQKYYDIIMSYVNGDVAEFNSSKRELPGYEAFAEAFSKIGQLEQMLTATVYANNTEKIIRCMELLADYNTKDLWIANYDYVERYVLIVRELVYSGEYNANAVGVKEALEAYVPVNAFFYEQLQLEHVGYINGVLEDFRAATSYISRSGYCAKITKYINENDIDYTNPDIIQLIGTYEAYLDELEVQKEDYSDILNENTVYFVNTVALIGTCNSYAAVAELYDIATEYYYAMNVGGDEVQQALEIYAKTGEYLTKTRATTDAFIAETALIEGEDDREELFAYLATCYQLIDDLELSIDGAAEAYETFASIYATYNSHIDTVNGEIDSTVDTCLALRCGRGLDSFLDTLLGLVK